jgi:hypothetical protein
LVALADFSSATTNFPNSPPNSFKAASSAKDLKSNMFCAAVACGLVGCSQAKPGSTVFDGSIPGGYIQITNAAGATLPPGFNPSDNSNNIFNNELYYQPGLLTADSGTSQIFAAVNPNTMDSSAVSNMQAWANWAQAGGTGTPPSSTAGMYIATQAGQAGTPLNNPPTKAQLQALTGMTNSANCLDQLNAQGVLSGNCQTWLQSYSNTYSPLPSAQAQSSMPSGAIYSSVDVAKADVLAAFQSDAQSATLPAVFPTTGLGVYPPGANGQSGPPGSYGLTWPQVNGPLQQAGTVLALLNQVDSQSTSTCQMEGVMAQLLQRCKEIKPGTTQAELNALLGGASLPMGATLYLYRTESGLGNLTVSQTPPPTKKSNLMPDSNPNASLAQCSNSYNVMGTLVDTSSLTTGTGQGDDNLHGQPYLASSGGFTTTDYAGFVLSSGYGNLLGELNFFNSVTSSPSGSTPSGSNPSGSGSSGTSTSTPKPTTGTLVLNPATGLESLVIHGLGGTVVPTGDLTSDGSTTIHPN